MNSTQIYERQLRLGMAGDRAGQAEWYAPEAVLEAPFAADGAPRRYEGRDRILAMWAALDAARPADLRILEDESTLTVHATTDPNLIVAEIEAVAESAAVGRRIPVRQVHVVRIEDGRIVHVKDYHSTSVAAQA